MLLKQAVPGSIQILLLETDKWERKSTGQTVRIGKLEYSCELRKGGTEK